MYIKPKKGDVIYADRGFYRHYGIYVKDSCIIHYTNLYNDFGGKPTVRKTTLEEFCKNNPYFIYQFPVGQKVYHPWRTVWRAKSRLGDSYYDIFSYNCEHFVFWCKTGMVESSQIKQLFDGLSTIPIIGNGIRFFLDKDMQNDWMNDFCEKCEAFEYSFIDFMNDLTDKTLILFNKITPSESTNFEETGIVDNLAKYKKENLVRKIINKIRSGIKDAMLFLYGCFAFLYYKLKGF